MKNCLLLLLVALLDHNGVHFLFFSVNRFRKISNWSTLLQYCLPLIIMLMSRLQVWCIIRFHILCQKIGFEPSENAKLVFIVFIVVKDVTHIRWDRLIRLIRNRYRRSGYNWFVNLIVLLDFMPIDFIVLLFLADLSIRTLLLLSSLTSLLFPIYFSELVCFRN